MEEKEEGQGDKTKFPSTQNPAAQPILPDEVEPRRTNDDDGQMGGWDGGGSVKTRSRSRGRERVERVVVTQHTSSKERMPHAYGSVRTAQEKKKKKKSSSVGPGETKKCWLIPLAGVQSPRNGLPAQHPSRYPDSAARLIRISEGGRLAFRYLARYLDMPLSVFLAFWGRARMWPADATRAPEAPRYTLAISCRTRYMLRRWGPPGFACAFITGFKLGTAARTPEAVG